ncbi:MAG: hypothetical protein H6741_21220 [Alphaproteobacteria bacterium]|nr:hypothetical protein [Alphaproteobacteria bacterium]
MPWRPLLALSLLAFGLSLALALGALEAMPHVSDEQAYLLQARVFAGGARFAPTPVDGVAIVNVYQRLEPGWHGLFPVGWPLVLALGVLLGLPSAVNPLLTAALPWAAWWALSPHLPRRAALLSAGILALSPFSLVLGASMMSHTLTLLCGLLVTGAATHPALGPRRALLGGLALGGMMLTRPFDACLVGLPLCAWVAWRGRETGWGSVLAFAAGPLLALGVQAADNLAVTGSWSRFGVQDWYARPTPWGQTYPEGCNALGFGPDRGCFGAPGYGPGQALAQSFSSLLLYDRLFMGFMGSSFAALLGLPLLLRRRGVLALPALSLPLGYALYWYHGVVYGPRFLSGMALACAPAAALALDRAAAWLQARGQRPALVWGVPILGLLAVAPLLWMELSDDYWCADAGRRRWVEARGVEAGVLVVQDRGERAARWPLTTRPDADRCTPPLAQGAVLGWNDPWGKAPLTWIEAMGPLDEAAGAAATRHPGEAVYVLLRDLESGAMRLGRWEQGQLRELDGGR